MGIYHGMHYKADGWKTKRLCNYYMTIQLTQHLLQPTSDIEQQRT